MKITNIAQAMKNHNRANISVDGSYRFSLDIFQVGEFGLKIGKEYSEEELAELETESQFGKLYGRALEYTLMRPHSAKEIRDYLWRKTRSIKMRSRKTGEVITKEGVSQLITDRVFNRLEEKGYIDDEKFARFWIENRNQTKGTSLRKLQNELRAKGVASSIIESVLSDSSRNDEDELMKVVRKKQSKYPDEQKLIQYLMRQGFRYDDIKSALSQSD
jgi:regulatory protein